MKRDMTGGAVVLAAMAALARRRLPGPGHRPGRRPPRTPSAATRCAPATSSATTAAAPPRSPTPTPRAGWCSPTRWPTPWTSSTRPSLVDVATLTGAMKVALGQQVGGLLRQRRRPRRPRSRGRRRRGGRAAVAVPAGRRLRGAARPPRSPTPTTPPGGPGAITAALFLQHFVGGVPWAHLDIASVGDSPDDRYEWTKGPTGFGARACCSAGSAPTTRWRASRDECGPDRPLVARRRARRGRGAARDYVAETSHARFTGMAGLRFKTWRMLRG